MDAPSLHPSKGPTKNPSTINTQDCEDDVGAVFMLNDTEVNLCEWTQQEPISRCMLSVFGGMYVDSYCRKTCLCSDLSEDIPQNERSPVQCMDNYEALFKLEGKVSRLCVWAREEPDGRCIISTHDGHYVYNYCPETCNMCPGMTASFAHPFPFPTSAPMPATVSPMSATYSTTYSSTSAASSPMAATLSPTQSSPTLRALRREKNAGTKSAHTHCTDNPDFHTNKNDVSITCNTITSEALRSMYCHKRRRFQDIGPYRPIKEYCPVSCNYDCSSVLLSSVTPIKASTLSMTIPPTGLTARTPTLTSAPLLVSSSKPTKCDDDEDCFAVTDGDEIRKLCDWANEKRCWYANAMYATTESLPKNAGPFVRDLCKKKCGVC